MLSDMPLTAVSVLAWCAEFSDEWLGTCSSRRARRRSRRARRFCGCNWTSRCRSYTCRRRSRGYGVSSMQCGRTTHKRSSRLILTPSRDNGLLSLLRVSSLPVSIPFGFPMYIMCVMPIRYEGSACTYFLILFSPLHSRNGI